MSSKNVVSDAEWVEARVAFMQLEAEHKADYRSCQETLSPSMAKNRPRLRLRRRTSRPQEPQRSVW